MTTENPTASDTKRRGSGARPRREHPLSNPGDVIITDLAQLGTTLEEYLALRGQVKEESLTGSASKLARSETAVDFLIPRLGRRFLAYPRSPDDDRTYDAFTQTQIPQFTREGSPNPDVTVVQVPLHAWRLDSTDFQEEAPIFPAGNGAIEIMKKLGVLLNKIYVTTQTLPLDLGLSQVAFVTGDNDFIKLVPPYSLSADVNPNELVSRIGQELNAIDPNNPHEEQIKALRASLLKTAK